MGMSDSERQEILLLLGRIEERTDALLKSVYEIRNQGCTIGQKNIHEIEELKKIAEKAKGLWKYAVIVMIGVATGSVGLKETISSIIEMLTK